MTIAQRDRQRRLWIRVVWPSRKCVMPDPVYRHLVFLMREEILVVVLTTASIEGEAIARELRDELLAVVASTCAKKVVIDFHQTRFVSSAAFRPLLSLRRRLQESGGRVILCGLTPSIGDIFYTTRMVSPDGVFVPMFEMAPGVEDAIAIMNNNGVGPG